MPPPPVIWLPDALDRLEHAVVDTDVLRAAAAGVAEVVAVCSVPVQLCSLATPTAQRCPDCDVRVTRDHAPAGDRPRWARRSRWGRATPA